MTIKPGIEQGEFIHQPVMVQEVLTHLQLKPGMVVIDGTVGLGGHAGEILKVIAPSGRMLALDRDEAALERAKVNLKAWESQTLFYHSTYDRMEERWRSSGSPAASAILLDLGVSSLQIDDASRGFSFLEDAPLDMRMNCEDELTAAEIVNHYSEARLVQVLRDYGEETAAPKIAERILFERRKNPITTTKQLATLVIKAMPWLKRGRIHPATRTFQALRIEVNRELQILEKFLAAPMPFLQKGGRLAVLSFHSLEDRRVKQFGKNREAFKKIHKKPLTPSFEEVKHNPRCRSAKLRVFEKIGD
ncbi:MAG: 16S rRNA (cytosine(1402)-N(4))-methyltransferase RsmH [Deltaproteobacteria bacterium]|nr:16S rRNA (cytosine(1402)-N(4))-methyltransferase RsmH [Deltaproteobacteria bacterium]